MLKAKKLPGLAVDALTILKVIGAKAGGFKRIPIHGVVAALSQLDAIWSRRTLEKAATGGNPSHWLLV
jgi:hypothetical protein